MNSAWTFPKERPHIDDLATLQYQEKCSKQSVVRWAWQLNLAGTRSDSSPILS